MHAHNCKVRQKSNVAFICFFKLGKLRPREWCEKKSLSPHNNTSLYPFTLDKHVNKTKIDCSVVSQVVEKEGRRRERKTLRVGKRIGLFILSYSHSSLSYSQCLREWFCFARYLAIPTRSEILEQPISVQERTHKSRLYAVTSHCKSNFTALLEIRRIIFLYIGYLSGDSQLSYPITTSYLVRN